jgi:hypothetical protein
MLCHPAEISVANFDYIIKLLAAVGLDISTPLSYVNEHNPDTFLNVLDGVREMISLAEKQISSYMDRLANTESSKLKAKPASGNWEEFIESANTLLGDNHSHRGLMLLGGPAGIEHAHREIERFKSYKQYFVDVERVLLDHGAKTWDECHPDRKRRTYSNIPYEEGNNSSASQGFKYIGSSNILVPARLWPLYQELYEACLLGDNEKIQKLCFPSSNSKESGQEQLCVTVAINIKNGYNYNRGE